MGSDIHRSSQDTINVHGETNDLGEPYGAYDGVTSVLIPHMTPTLSSPLKVEGKQSSTKFDVIQDKTNDFRDIG